LGRGLDHWTFGFKIVYEKTDKTLKNLMPKKDLLEPCGATSAVEPAVSLHLICIVSPFAGQY